MTIRNNRFECPYLELFRYNTLKEKHKKHAIMSFDVHKHVLLHNRLKECITGNTVVLCDNKLDGFNELKINLPSVISGGESIEYSLRYQNLYNIDLLDYDEYISMENFLRLEGCLIGTNCMVLTTLKPPLV